MSWGMKISGPHQRNQMLPPPDLVKSWPPCILCLAGVNLATQLPRQGGCQGLCRVVEQQDEGFREFGSWHTFVVQNELFSCLRAFWWDAAGARVHHLVRCQASSLGDEGAAAQVKALMIRVNAALF
jgi:hypothetical protein